MFYSCVQSRVNVDVNTFASRRAELIGNAAIVESAANPLLRLPVGASYAETQGRPVAVFRFQRLKIMLVVRF